MGCGADEAEIRTHLRGTPGAERLRVFPTYLLGTSPVVGSDQDSGEASLPVVFVLPSGLGVRRVRPDD